MKNNHNKTLENILFFLTTAGLLILYFSYIKCMVQ